MKSEDKRLTEAAELLKSRAEATIMADYARGLEQQITGVFPSMQMEASDYGRRLAEAGAPMPKAGDLPGELNNYWVYAKSGYEIAKRAVSAELMRRSTAASDTVWDFERLHLGTFVDKEIEAKAKGVLYIPSAEDDVIERARAHGRDERAEIYRGKALRRSFDADVLGISQRKPLELLVVATRLPSGAVEAQMNTSGLADKIAYIQSTYDESFCMKHAPSIQIVGYMLV